MMDIPRESDRTGRICTRCIRVARASATGYPPYQGVARRIRLSQKNVCSEIDSLKLTAGFPVYIVTLHQLYRVSTIGQSFLLSLNLLRSISNSLVRPLVMRSDHHAAPANVLQTEPIPFTKRALEGQRTLKMISRAPSYARCVSSNVSWIGSG